MAEHKPCQVIHFKMDATELKEIASCTGIGNRSSPDCLLPMLLLILITLVSSIVGLCMWHEESRWALAVMGAFAFALLIACVVTLGDEFVRELQRRFHVK